jgi:hypothetical protein
VAPVEGAQGQAAAPVPVEPEVPLPPLVGGALPALGRSSVSLPACSLSMDVTPPDVTVLKVTESPTARELKVASPFLSMSLVLVTG